MTANRMTVFEFIQHVADAYPDNEDIYNLEIQLETDCHGCHGMAFDMRVEGEGDDRVVVLEAM